MQELENVRLLQVTFWGLEVERDKTSIKQRMEEVARDRWTKRYPRNRWTKRYPRYRWAKRS